jgi:hypothetical protein
MLGIEFFLLIFCFFDADGQGQFFVRPAGVVNEGSK